MLDQNFSAKNFMNVYALENRMGKIPVETMSDNFQAVVDMIKKANSELQTLKNKKKEEKTDEVKDKIKNLKRELKILREESKSLFLQRCKDCQGMSIVMISISNLSKC